MKPNNKVGSNIVKSNLVIGLVLAMAVMLAGAAVGAVMISTGSLPENTLGYISIMVLLLTGFSGAAVGTGRATEKRLLNSMMSAGGCFAALLAITALFFEGQYDRIGITALMLLLGAFSAAIMPKGKGRQRNSRYRKNRRR